MATPAGSEYVELVGASSTLLLGSAGIVLSDASGLLTVGSSRGQDLVAGQAAGRLQRDRVRDSFTEPLGFRIIGQYDQDGNGVADPVANALSLWQTVRDFPDSEGRAFTVRYTQFSSVFEAPAVFEEFGPWSRPDEAVFYGSLIVTVPSGVLSLVTP